MHASLANQAYILRRQGKLKEALQMHEEAYQSVKEIGAAYYIAESTLFKGIILMQLGQFKEASQLYQESLQMAKDHGYVGLQGQVLISTGKLFALQGRHREAVEKYKDAFEVVQKRGFKVIMVEALINMVILLASSGDPKLPFQILDRAFQIAVTGEAKTSMDAYSEKKESKEAPQVVPPKGDYRLGLAEIFNAGGYVLMRMQRMEEALKTLQKAYDLATKHNYPLIEALTLSNMGCCFLRLGQHDNAGTKLKAAAQRFEELGVQSEVTTAIPGLTELYPELMEAGPTKEAAESKLDSLLLLDPWITAKRVRQLLTHIRS
ncbi:MAG: tetratricopeptide repeat protein, partial [Promethearchaeota archaeon]